MNAFARLERCSFLLSLVCIHVGVLGVEPAPGPVSDSFAGRIQLVGTNTSVTGDNRGASLEPGEPPSAGASVWYSWTAGMTGRAWVFYATTAYLSTVTPWTPAIVQVRAWDARSGATYEEARALGGRFGKSEVLSIIPTTHPAVPALLIGLQSFSLRGGLPRFAVGRVELAEQRADGTLVWQLQGEPTFRYLVERTTNNFAWTPLMVVTNSTGTTTFIDQTPAPAGHVFYRSRILD